MRRTPNGIPAHYRASPRSSRLTLYSAAQRSLRRRVAARPPPRPGHVPVRQRRPVRGALGARPTARQGHPLWPRRLQARLCVRASHRSHKRNHQMFRTEVFVAQTRATECCCCRWRNGAQHGTGVYINAEGQAFRATWENGKGYIEAPLAPEPPKAAPAAKAAAKSAVATGSAEAPQPAAAPSKASITLEQVSAGLEASVTEPKEPFVDVPEDGACVMLCVGVCACLRLASVHGTHPSQCTMR